MKKAKAVHPGEVLRIDFLQERGISVLKLAQELNMSQTKIFAILNRNAPITNNTAYRLALLFNNPASYWMVLQKEFDMQRAI